MNIYVVPVGEVQYKYIMILTTRNDPVVIKMKKNKELRGMEITIYVVLIGEVQYKYKSILTIRSYMAMLYIAYDTKVFTV